MSLYTISKSERLPAINIPLGLRIFECKDVQRLSTISSITVDHVISRMNDGHRAFVAYMNGKAAGFGWMATKKAFIGELNHHFMMPAQNRYLWNFRTLAEYRGLGIYPALLQYIVRQERPKAAQFWIIHAPENFSSRRGISKAGFRYVGKLYTQIGQGALIEFPPSGPRYLDLLSQMGFNSSNDKGASCWNCSSPYLKNRTEDCCCFVTSDRCVEMAVSL